MGLSKKGKHPKLTCGNVGMSQCHKNGDEWGMVYGIAIPTLIKKTMFLEPNKLEVPTIHQADF